MDHAAFGDALATGVEDVRTGEAAVDALDGGGFWAVVATFEGAVTAVRFGSVVRGPVAPSAGRWAGLPGPWRSSIDEAVYRDAVEEVRRRVAAGTVYQVNICRILSHELPESADLDALAAVLRAGNPAPYAARIRVDAAGLDLVSASPESYLERDGERIVSRPIKGTSRPGEPM
ncbi:MAG TPA: chorismate-binding protein, partial [Dermatophilaceae bacterium]|nr:chorismate-binding protein [Dermatophilaceae bacterium]